MAIETKVVVAANKAYTGGEGYNGAHLRRLGIPVGPYTPKVAQIVQRQLAPNIKVVIADYIEV